MLIHHMVHFDSEKYLNIYFKNNVDQRVLLFRYTLGFIQTFPIVN